MIKWLALAGAVLALDVATKWAAVRWLAPNAVVEVTPFLNLVLVYNPGAAFSLLADGEPWQRAFFIALAAAASVWIVYLLHRHPEERGFAAALALVLAGALGNLIDRVRLGAVIDFLDFHAFGWHWPAFNLADSAITCGAVLLVWDALRARAKPEPRGQDPGDVRESS